MKENIINLKILTFLICSIGIITLYSASSAYAASRFSDYKYFFENQSIRLLIGLVLLIITSHINYRIYNKNSRIIIISCWILIFMGFLTSQHLPTSRGLILFGKNIVSTSDVAKFGLIVYLASYVELHRKDINNMKDLLSDLIPYLGLTLLLIFFQPDMSTTFTISLILLALIYVAGLKTKYIFYTIISGALVVVLKILSTSYQFRRFINWFSGNGDSQSSGSILALSNGGLFGNGLDGSLIKKGHLPAAHTDFMLPIIGEEFGFIGISLIFILFFMFLYYSIKILQHIDDCFGFFLSLGITMNVIVYFLINSAYVVGVFPTTGLPLPFMSYGGSHIILSLASMGVMFNIAKNNLSKKRVVYNEV